jgi:pimeloyl-ACP methyl ester carboxylesterase
MRSIRDFVLRRRSQPADGEMVFRGEHYEVRRWASHRPGPAVVIFENWKPNPGFAGEFSGQRFFTKRGIACIGIRPARNDWYQGREMAAVIAAIRKHTVGAKLIGYGGSMGGYAALNFSEDLDLHAVIAICPQFSIQPSRAPFEKRWQNEAAATTFHHDKIDRIRPIQRGHIVYDPWCVDGLHAQRILARHALSPVKIHFGGHHVMQALVQMDIYSALLLDLVGGTFDGKRFAQDVRRARRMSPVIWMQVSESLGRSGTPASALIAAEHALSLPLKEPSFDLAINHARALAGAGRPAEAEAVLGVYLADPAYAEAMPWFYHDIGLAMPDTGTSPS